MELIRGAGAPTKIRSNLQFLFLNRATRKCVSFRGVSNCGVGFVLVLESPRVINRDCELGSSTWRFVHVGGFYWMVW